MSKFYTKDKFNMGNHVSTQLTLAKLTVWDLHKWSSMQHLIKSIFLTVDTIPVYVKYTFSTNLGGKKNPSNPSLGLPKATKWLPYTSSLLLLLHIPASGQSRQIRQKRSPQVFMLERSWRFLYQAGTTAALNYIQSEQNTERSRRYLSQEPRNRANVPGLTAFLYESIPVKVSAAHFSLMLVLYGIVFCITEKGLQHLSRSVGDNNNKQWQCLLAEVHTNVPYNFIFNNCFWLAQEL